MGIDLPQDHDDRYAMAQEWWEVVRRLWSEPGRYDIDGRFWRLLGVESNPKPYDGLPPILNAGSSPQGRDFAAATPTWCSPSWAAPRTEPRWSRR